MTIESPRKILIQPESVMEGALDKEFCDNGSILTMTTTDGNSTMESRVDTKFPSDSNVL